MVKMKKLALALVLPLLASCATTKQMPSDVLIKLPQKKIVNIHSVTKLTPVDNQLAREKTVIEKSMIQSSPTPIWIPPIITNVLIMPYVDKNGALHSYQNVFLKLAKGRWLIGNYLMNTDGEVKVFDPLSSSTVQWKSKIAHSIKNNVKHSNTSSTQKSFFNGGQPRTVNNPTISPSSSGSHSSKYYQNTINSMRR